MCSCSIRPRGAGSGAAARSRPFFKIVVTLRAVGLPISSARAHAASTLPFKQVLCAVDFSDPSLEAVRFAGSLASQAGARLVLMHVLEWPWHEPPAPRLVDLPPAQAAALAEYRRYVEATATAEARTRLRQIVGSESHQAIAAEMAKFA